MGAITGIASVNGAAKVLKKIAGTISGIASVVGGLTGLAEAYARILRIFTGISISQDLNITTAQKKGLMIASQLRHPLNIISTIKDK